MTTRPDLRVVPDLCDPLDPAQAVRAFHPSACPLIERGQRVQVSPFAPLPMRGQVGTVVDVIGAGWYRVTVEQGDDRQTHISMRLRLDEFCVVER